VYYDGKVVGEFAADVVVDGKILLELKSVREVVAAHEAQLRNYLKATQMGVGLLINFGPNGVDIRRRDNPQCSHENESSS